MSSKLISYTKFFSLFKKSKPKAKYFYIALLKDSLALSEPPYSVWVADDIAMGYHTLQEFRSEVKDLHNEPNIVKDSLLTSESAFESKRKEYNLEAKKLNNK